MFTGLVQGLGTISNINKSNKEIVFKISPNFSIIDYKKGESIAVNGVCLTVENFDKNSFQAYASFETVKSTNFSFLKQGSTVNLERALKIGDRLGGHLVSGHIDGTAEIINIESADSSIKYTIKLENEHINHVIAKGSIALDGISLTINKCENDIIDVNIIPQTQIETNIKNWAIGTKINIETDMIGKYVYKNMQNTKKTNQSNITQDFLLTNGFLS